MKAGSARLCLFYFFILKDQLLSVTSSSRPSGNEIRARVSFQFRNEKFFASSRKTRGCAETYEQYVAQETSQFDAEIAKKGHFWMKISSNPFNMLTRKSLIACKIQHRITIRYIYTITTTRSFKIQPCWPDSCAVSPPIWMRTKKFQKNDFFSLLFIYFVRKVVEVKVYEQKRTVDYAEYKVGMLYASPFDLFVDGKPVITKLSKNQNEDDQYCLDL